MFSLSSEKIFEELLKKKLCNQSAGALVTFEGWVRNHNDGRQVLTLEYEAYQPLAEKEAERIMEEAAARFPIISVRCVHRVGQLAVGDLAVWVGVVAEHRDAAFGACRFVIDEIKSRLPIWKKETYTDGASGWVNCHATGAHSHGSGVPVGDSEKHDTVTSGSTKQGGAPH